MKIDFLLIFKDIAENVDFIFCLQMFIKMMLGMIL